MTRYAICILTWMLLSLCPFLPVALARDDCRVDDTLLMFVGEDLEVLTIASRREESAGKAPAIATVITREVLAERGMFTLADALGQAPGFYMAPREAGTRPYLRGVPDAALFLYDTVPMTSDITKSVHPLDDELSLAPVKRVEIIRGPGSVLWGPDAFAGIVNVVPLTGKDVNGVETGADYGAPGDARGAFVNLGHDGGSWDGFVSITGRQTASDDTAADIVRFWGDGTTPTPPEERYGRAFGDRPWFVEMSGNAGFRDRLTLSGRYSDYSRPYAMPDDEHGQVWLENRSAPVSFVKLDSKNDVGQDAAVRLTGYYSIVNAVQETIDLSLSPDERTAYGELIYDRKLFAGAGLLTAGAATRNTRVLDAPVWDSYLPGYLTPENETFLPQVTEVDYRAELWSLFGQYAHKIGKIDVSAGLRHDAHHFYDDSLSHNLGLVWSPADTWRLKLLYGSAYRTPYTSQLLEKQAAGLSDITPRLEKINTVNAETAWDPAPWLGLTLGGFINHVSNHLMENPYAGLSDPNSQKIYGLEMEGRVFPLEGVKLTANLTLIHNSGPDEIYRYADGVIIDPDDGSIDINYTELAYPFDTGPDRLFNIMAEWRPVSRVTLFYRLGYLDRVDMICPASETTTTLPSAWLSDLAVTVRNVGCKGVDAGVYLYNLTDKDYQVPGTYSVIDGDPFALRVLFKKTW